MMTSLVVTIFVMVTVLPTAGASNGEWPWGYEQNKNGPSIWSQYYPKCKGTKQSPIDIDTRKVETDHSLGKLQIYNYDSPRNLSLLNNGHTIAVAVDGDIYIEGGGLGQRYDLAQFHFHWGQDNQRGSEHTLNSRQFPMEIHFVHYAHKYKSLDNARAMPDGLAVLGFLVEVSGLDNLAFKNIMAKLQHVQYKNEKRDISCFNLRSVLTSSSDSFFRYTGSLTTPACHESVTWSVFNTPIRISQRQLDAFRTMRASTIEHHEDLISLNNNYRPPQPINGRKVTTNVDYLYNNNNSATSTLSQFASIILLCFNTLVLALLHIGKFL